MSRTPEVIINKPLKLAHDFFKGIAILFGGLMLFALLAGGNFVPALLLCVASAYAASKIKYTLVKQVEVGGYKRV
ncbi:hypothetical protein [Hyphomicrobium sp.]|uniref:hypothetical protein n=1 Tax=Hyphomicrobium sp. TaxID=82 RepID=UPI0025B871E6|nr:hypothetical protein [Hyphomicrobium sp.]MCC7253063.1 hypothetical protein [Hyphomicrobium sp.]